MDLATWVREKTNTFIQFPGEFDQYECVNLVEQYCTDVLQDHANPPFRGNAIDFFGQRPTVYKWVHNDPHNLDQIPPRGAIMVWGPDGKIGTGPLGHTDVVLDASSYSFDGFDQNWPLHAPAHTIRHTYEGVIGWGYPHAWDAKPAPTPAPAPAPAPDPAPGPVVNPTPAEPMYMFEFAVASAPPPGDPVPAAGVMPFSSAMKIARDWVTAHPGVSLDVSTIVE